MKRHPDVFIGFVFTDSRTVVPDDISRYRDEGFTGLKFIYPPANYDDEKFDRIYHQAEKLKMPVLFHLGIVSRNDYKKVMAELKIPAEIQEKVLGGTMAKILGLED